MTNVKERDAEILRMRKEGATHKKIAQRFDLSPERVRQIVCQLELEEKRRKRTEEFRDIIRSSNGIEKKWPRDFILEALSFQGRGRCSLQRFLENQHTTEVSLKDLMDFLITDSDKLPVNRLEAMPAYRQKDVGVKTYSMLVHHLSGLDLGDAFNKEWARRLNKLMRHLSRTGQYIPSLLLRYLQH